MTSFLFLCTVFYWLEFTAFIWKAKGRHGTHSPFAYYLVDVVRRIQVDQLNTQSFPMIERKARRFLAKLQKALPSFAQINYSTQQACIQAAQPQIIYIDNNTPLEGLKQLKLHPESILVISPVLLRKQQKVWQQLCQHADFHFSADAWHFGLLSPRPQQVKQHFLLKLA